MADGVEIGRGIVIVSADQKPFDAAMADLPKKAAAKMDAAMKALQAKAASVKLQIGQAYKAGDLETQQKLIPVFENLKAKIAAVEAAAIKQGQAARIAANEAKAAAEAEAAQKKAAADAAKAKMAAEKAASQQAIRDAKEQLAIQKAIEQEVRSQESASARTRPGGNAGLFFGGTSGGGGGGNMGGAMGLLVLSQTIDDMQYGFRAIVNNIPQMGMALGSALGMSTESAMRLAGTLGIAAVAVNLLITHWDDLMDLMGMGRVLTEAEQMEKLAKATKLTADEQERLNRFKREESFRNDMINRATSGSEKTEADYRKVVADLGNDQTSGRNRLVAGLVAARRAEGRGAKMTDAEANRLASAQTFAQRNKGTEGAAFYESKAEKIGAAIQARLDAEDMKNAGKIVDTAGFNPERRKILANAIRANPDAFPANASRIGQISQAKNTTDEEERKRDLEVKLANRELERQERENQKAENSRLAAAMRNSVGQKFLANPQMSNETLEQEARKQMGKAGMSSSAIDAAAEGVAKAIRKQMDEEIRGRAMDRGIGEGQAAQQLLKEANELDERQANQPKAEIMSTESYMSKLLVGALNQKDGATKDLPQKQLDAAKETNKILANGFKTLANPKKGTYATAAPGGRA